MTTAFQLARLPIDAAIATGDFLLWPLKFGKTITTNTVDTAFKWVGANTEDDVDDDDDDDDDADDDETKKDSVYDMADINLDISSMIYYYTELRSAAKKLLREFAIEKKLSIDRNCNGQRNAIVLYNALKLVSKTEAALRSPEVSGTKALEEYRTSLSQLEALTRQFGLGAGDIEVFKTYFDILSEPKTLTGIKSDMILYDSIIDPQFRLAFGGSEYNRATVDRLIKNQKSAVDRLIDNQESTVDRLIDNPKSEGCYVHHIDDDFATTSLNVRGIVKGFAAEIVWAILVNDATKTITVVFRGSISGADWIQNFQCNTVDFELPGFLSEADDTKEKKTFGRVHEGFYEYMFERTKIGDNGSTKSKGEEIIGMLKGDFFDNDDKPHYKDYSLVVTGHSLGGALSTMLAFRAAALGDFPNIVTNVSFASPFVGDETFRESFVHLEKTRKIRHLRVSNHEDLVPLIPATTYPFPHGLNFPFPNGLDLYKHVGMNIRLYDSSAPLSPQYRRFYPKEGSFVDGTRNALHNELLSFGLAGAALLDNHLCSEYKARLDTATNLKKLTLDQLYGNKDVTGWDYAIQTSNEQQ